MNSISGVEVPRGFGLHSHLEGRADWAYGKTAPKIQDASGALCDAFGFFRALVAGLRWKQRRRANVGADAGRADDVERRAAVVRFTVAAANPA